METVLLQVNSKKVYKLIKGLESLNLVRVLKKTEEADEKSVSIYDFVGVWSKEEASEIRKAIEQSCETIDENDWK